jgi:hypothetical protein
MDIWSNLRPIDLRIFTPIWYILWSFGMFSPYFGLLDQDKSGNPAWLEPTVWPSSHLVSCVKNRWNVCL